MTSLRCTGAESPYIDDNTTKDFITDSKVGWTTDRIARMCGVSYEMQTDKEHEAGQVISGLRQLRQVILKKYFYDA